MKKGVVVLALLAVIAGPAAASRPERAPSPPSPQAKSAPAAPEKESFFDRIARLLRLRSDDDRGEGRQRVDPNGPIGGSSNCPVGQPFCRN